MNLKRGTDNAFPRAISTACAAMLAACALLSPLSADSVTTQAANSDYAYLQEMIDAGTLTAAELIDTDELTGWAAVAANGVEKVTGGGDAVPVLATDYYDLCMYAESDEPRVIIIAGELTAPRDVPVQVGSNTTIVGIDEYATLNSGFEISGKENVIISNLNIHGAWNNVGPEDSVTVENGSHHIWLDHLNIWDGEDGNMDIVTESDYVTVSWCKFWYSDSEKDHRLSNLIGSGGGDHDEDMGKLNVTYHHNWFADNCDQRMPRVMYGKAHIYNNYYTCTGNSYCVGAGSYAEILVEGNYFQNVNNPHQFMYALPTSINAVDNIYDHTTGSKASGIWGTGSAPASLLTADDLPYTYTADAAADVPDIVTAGVGPKMIVENPNGTPEPDESPSEPPAATDVPGSDSTFVQAIAVYEAGADGTDSAAKTDVVDVEDNEALAGSQAWKFTSGSSAVTLSNPLIGQSHLVEDISVDENLLPVWNEGVTITYWVKTTSGSRASALISFKGENVETIQKDSLAKYRLAAAYANALEQAEATQTTYPEDDPATEFYLKKVDAEGTVLGDAAAADGYSVIYDVYAYALAHGVVTEDMTAAQIEQAIYKGLQSGDAIPDLCVVSPGYDRRGAFLLSYNDDGTPNLNVTVNNNGNTSYLRIGNLNNNVNSGYEFDYTRYASIDNVFKGTAGSDIEYGWTTGLLQLHSDNSLLFAEDITNAARYRQGASTNSAGVQAKNYLYISASDELTELSPEADEEWHYVVYVIKNNEMYFYVDGNVEEQVCLPDLTSYSTEPGTNVGKSFNLGTGYAYPYKSKGTSYDMSYSYYDGNCNGATLMEFLTAKTTTTLNIGSAGIGGVSSTYRNGVYNTVSGTQIARVKVYDAILSGEQVSRLYDAGDPAEGIASGTQTEEPVPDTTETPQGYLRGDVDRNGEIEAADALLVLKQVVRLAALDEEQTALADVNTDGEITAADALRILQHVVKLVTIV